MTLSFILGITVKDRHRSLGNICVVLVPISAVEASNSNLLDSVVEVVEDQKVYRIMPIADPNPNEESSQ